jgi:hypothetical protein
MTFKNAILDTLRVIIPTVITVALTSAMSSARAEPAMHGAVAATATANVTVLAPQAISAGQSLAVRSAQ